MHTNFPRLFTAMAFLMVTNCAVAQEIGDAKAGSAFAAHICAECHAVRAGESKSPLAQAPSFQTVANTSGMTGAALKVWLQTAHRSMPNLVVGQEDSDNVIAYILGLKKGS